MAHHTLRIIFAGLSNGERSKNGEALLNQVGVVEQCPQSGLNLTIEVGQGGGYQRVARTTGLNKTLVVEIFKVLQCASSESLRIPPP